MLLTRMAAKLAMGRSEFGHTTCRLMNMIDGCVA